MTRKKWSGTALFAGVLATMALTLGLRLYGQPAAAAAPLQPAAAAAATPHAGGGDHDGDGDGGKASAKPAAPKPAAPAPAPQAAAAVAGSVQQTPYGPLQVQVTFAGTKITAVAELQAPTGGRSDRINSAARPILAQEVLASQSARIDTVSGATYTSQAYAASVQSAIDGHK